MKPAMSRRTRNASGRTIGGRLSSLGWAISTCTSTASPIAPNESTGRYVNVAVPDTPGGGSKWSAGSPDGPCVSVTVPPMSGTVNVSMRSASRSGSMSLISTSMSTALSVAVSATSGDPIGARLTVSTGSSSIVTVAESSVPSPSTIVYSNWSTPR